MDMWLHLIFLWDIFTHSYTNFNTSIADSLVKVVSWSLSVKRDKNEVKKIHPGCYKFGSIIHQGITRHHSSNNEIRIKSGFLQHDFNSLWQGFRKSFSAWGLYFKRFSAGFNFEIVGHGYKDFINRNKHVQHRCTSALKLWESNQKQMTNMKHMIYWKKFFDFFFKSKYIFGSI